MDSLTRRGCVTLWKSESSLDHRSPLRLRNAPASPGFCSTSKNPGSVKARGLGWLWTSGNYP